MKKILIICCLPFFFISCKSKNDEVKELISKKMSAEGVSVQVLDVTKLEELTLKQYCKYAMSGLGVFLEMEKDNAAYNRRQSEEYNALAAITQETDMSGEAKSRKQDFDTRLAKSDSAIASYEKQMLNFIALSASKDSSNKYGYLAVASCKYPNVPQPHDNAFLVSKDGEVIPVRMDTVH